MKKQKIDKELLLDYSYTTRQDIEKSFARRKRIGSSLTIYKFKDNKFIGEEHFDNTIDAGEKIYLHGRYNYLHTKFTVAKMKNKRILYIPNSELGEVFIIKDKDKKHFQSILPYDTN